MSGEPVVISDRVVAGRRRRLPRGYRRRDRDGGIKHPLASVGPGPRGARGSAGLALGLQGSLQVYSQLRHTGMSYNQSVEMAFSFRCWAARLQFWIAPSAARISEFEQYPYQRSQPASSNSWSSARAQSFVLLQR
jgi:hypothetical protein